MFPSMAGSSKRRRLFFHSGQSRNFYFKLKNYGLCYAMLLYLYWLYKDADYIAKV